jgi:hypothetical protein
MSSTAHTTECARVQPVGAPVEHAGQPVGDLDEDQRQVVGAGGHPLAQVHGAEVVVGQRTGGRPERRARGQRGVEVRGVQVQGVAAAAVRVVVATGPHRQRAHQAHPAGGRTGDGEGHLPHDRQVAEPVERLGGLRVQAALVEHDEAQSHEQGGGGGRVADADDGVVGLHVGSGRGRGVQRLRGAHRGGSWLAGRVGRGTGSLEGVGPIGGSDPDARRSVDVTGANHTFHLAVKRST